MNGSQSWGDFPPSSPTFAPSRLELAARAKEWIGTLPHVSALVESYADSLAVDAASEESDDTKLFNYDMFIRDLLCIYTDSEIYNAQISWIRSETERMERENNTKGDADNG